MSVRMYKKPASAHMAGIRSLKWSQRHTRLEILGIESRRDERHVPCQDRGHRQILDCSCRLFLINMFCSTRYSSRPDASAGKTINLTVSGRRKCLITSCQVMPRLWLRFCILTSTHQRESSLCMANEDLLTGRTVLLRCTDSHHWAYTCAGICLSVQ